MKNSFGSQAKAWELEGFINSCLEANREIYQLFLYCDDSFKNKVSQGFGGDVSIKADLEAEKIFIKYLSKYGQIFSEESGYVGEGEFKIVIDPLDGSDNFKSNFPYYGTSVSLKKDDKVLAGIITNLSNSDVFIKTSDYFKKGKLFSKSCHDVVENSFSTIGIFERAYANKPLANKLKDSGIKFRISGAVALSLAYAREVDFVLFYGTLREFDISAGFFMCEGLYSFHNKDTYLFSKDKQIFDKIKSLIMLT